jgi:hypothetical protein
MKTNATTRPATALPRLRRREGIMDRLAGEAGGRQRIADGWLEA